MPPNLFSAFLEPCDLALQISLSADNVRAYKLYLGLLTYVLNSEHACKQTVWTKSRCPRFGPAAGSNIEQILSVTGNRYRKEQVHISETGTGSRSVCRRLYKLFLPVISSAFTGYNSDHCSSVLISCVSKTRQLFSAR